MPLLKENVITATKCHCNKYHYCKKMSLHKMSLTQENVTATNLITSRKCLCNKKSLLQENFLTTTKFHDWIKDFLKLMENSTNKWKEVWIVIWNLE